MEDFKLCPYCDKLVKIVMGSDLHPHLPTLASIPYYICWDCDAHTRVGVRGTMANKVLRKLRTETHNVFDQLWLKKYMTRNEAYTWLAKTMQIDLKDCHMSVFDYPTCLRAHDISNAELQRLKQCIF